MSELKEQNETQVKLQESSDASSKDLPRSRWLLSGMRSPLKGGELRLLFTHARFGFSFFLPADKLGPHFPFVSCIPVLSVWRRGVLRKILASLYTCFYYQIHVHSCKLKVISRHTWTSICHTNLTLLRKTFAHHARSRNLLHFD